MNATSFSSSISANLGNSGEAMVESNGNLMYILCILSMATNGVPVSLCYLSQPLCLYKP